MTVRYVSFIALLFATGFANAEGLSARIDVREAYCLDGTEDPGSDEFYMLIAGRNPDNSRYDGVWPSENGEVNAPSRDVVFDPDHRVVVWEGTIPNGSSVDVNVTFMEQDSGDASFRAEKVAQLVVAIASENWALVAALIADEVFSNGPDDYIGSFTITVRNNGGVLEPSIRRGKYTAHEGYNQESKTSKSGKTYRMVMHHDGDLGQTTTYGAEVQVQGDDGKALKW